MNMFDKVVQRIKGKNEMAMEIERLLSEGANKEGQFEEEDIQMHVEASNDSDIDKGIEEVPESIPMHEMHEDSEMQGDSEMPETEDKNGLLEELKHDDIASIEHEYGMLKELEDVTALELVEELTNLLREMR
jgi:hypothetical protein